LGEKIKRLSNKKGWEKAEKTGTGEEWMSGKSTIAGVSFLNEQPLQGTNLLATLTSFLHIGE